MDLPKIKDIKDLQAILDLMSRNDLAEIEIEAEGQRLRLRKIEPHVAGEKLIYTGEANVTSSPASQAVDAGSAESQLADDADVVPSPLVGTFYRSSSPEADPFVQEGDRVEEGAVLCIVEAMKVMNEIRAEKAGVVREILAKNAEPVEFGQPLFRIEPD